VALDILLLFAYTVSHVSGCRKSPRLCYPVQRVFRKYPCAGYDTAGIMDRGEMPVVWRAPSIPALGGVPRTALSPTHEEAGADG
jgi:hypothetical protein